MKKSLVLAIALLGASLMVGCSKTEEDAGPKLGSVVKPDGKPLSPEEVKNLPKSEGAFDGIPAGVGPGGKKGPK